MEVLALGSGAGGGFPQWNCGCRNCSSVREGKFAGKARTQAQLAVSSGGSAWFLLGASPDLRAQIEATPSLHPCDGARHSPIAGVVLTSADLDQVLGLLLLRELQPLEVYSTASIRRILREDNSMFGMLERVPGQVKWNDLKPEQEFWLGSGSQHPGLRCQTVPLGSRYPAYVREERKSTLVPEEALLGLVLESREGKRVGYFPAVPGVDDKLLKVLESVDLLFFDGTFWSDDELIRVQGQGPTAREMGHLPVASPSGSLELLARLRRPRKVFLHINNTNPMLNQTGSEFRAVRAAGWEVAEDGWQFQL
jgi:pyrroloquinoline quinone biosynthesis protein B